ncbi:MAG: nucleotidyltransferase family protein [Thermoprotei archaeon]
MYGTKAVILAGGYGKRLRPLTDERPKPMVEVNGKPIIEWQIVWLKKYNVRSFIFLTGYKREVLIEWVTKNAERLGISYMFLTENEPLGTGGAIKRLKDFLHEEFLVLNGDIITDLDVSRLKLKDGEVAAIALVPLRSPYGIIQVADGKVKAFMEKPVLKEYWINAGVYKFSPKIFEYLPDKGDLERTTFPTLAERGVLGGVTFPEAYWRSIDTMKDLEEASAEVREIFKGSQ